MQAFEIIDTKPTWMGYVILCQEVDRTYTVWHTDTADCRTGRYWCGHTYCELDKARNEFETRTY